MKASTFSWSNATNLRFWLFATLSKKLITTLQDFDASKEYLEESGVVYKFKQMAFRPNRLVAFAPCDESWHSVPLQKLPEGVARNTVQGFVSFHSKEGE